MQPGVAQKVSSFVVGSVPLTKTSVLRKLAGHFDPGSLPDPLPPMMPGFTQTSVYGKLWAASGLQYPDLCDRLVQIAVERYAAERALRF